jgi:hypothetical protein
MITDKIRLIYVSQPFGYDAATLAGILMDARSNNARDQITGALVCRHDVFMQLLEGPDRKVEAAFERISRDDRHVAVRKLAYRPVFERIFGSWAMLHDPVETLIWSEDEIAAGALDRATAEEVEKVFEDLAARVGSQTQA